MGNVTMDIRTFLHESINMKALLKECFADDKRFTAFRAKTAHTSIARYKVVKTVRTGLLTF